MSDKLYTIGKISALTNVSIDQLRNYDKIGLLKPEGRGSNNYRYYTENQLEDILVIKELKNIGIPLRMIGKFLENGDLETIQKTMEEASEESQRIEEKVAEFLGQYHIFCAPADARSKLYELKNLLQEYERLKTRAARSDAAREEFDNT